METQLPPAFVALQQKLRAERKTLLREKAYAEPEQLRAFIAQFLYPRIDELVELMGLALSDTYSLAVSSENQIHRMRAVYGKALNKLGADVGTEEGDLPGVSPDVLDDFQQAFFTLGSLLKAKLPDDLEVVASYNKCAELMSGMVEALLGGEEDEEDEDENAEEDEEDEEGEGEQEEKPAPKKRAAKKAEEPAVDLDGATESTDD
jgi:hypothetical protein